MQDTEAKVEPAQLTVETAKEEVADWAKKVEAAEIKVAAWQKQVEAAEKIYVETQEQAPLIYVHVGS
jgi:predicted  nucleic acid-binding Zn-ribbon protein